MSSLDRMLSLLDLFTDARPSWSVEQAIEVTGFSRSTVYRYFKSLCQSGLLQAQPGGGFELGPGIIELDRRIRLADPLLRVARPALAALMRETRESVLLARLYGDRLVCVHHEQAPRDEGQISLRGMALPLFRGAAGKVILAHLPTRRSRLLYRGHAHEVTETGLGADWSEVRSRLRTMRREGHSITRGELAPGEVALAVPVLDVEESVIAGLMITVPGLRYAEERAPRLLEGLRGAATQMRDALGHAEPAEALPAGSHEGRL